MLKKEELFDLYTDYLISSFGATTATGLSEIMEHTISHDQITRMLASEKKSSIDLWKIVKPFVKEISSEDGVLIVEDSISEKP